MSEFWPKWIISTCVKASNVDVIESVNKIGAEVYHLVGQLPSQKAFNIYMDNYFSSINLFSFLWKKDISACETVRINTAKFPVILKEKEKEQVKFFKEYCSR